MEDRLAKLKTDIDNVPGPEHESYYAVMDLLNQFFNELRDKDPVKIPEKAKVRWSLVMPLELKQKIHRIAREQKLTIHEVILRFLEKMTEDVEPYDYRKDETNENCSNKL